VSVAPEPQRDDAEQPPELLLRVRQPVRMKRGEELLVDAGNGAQIRVRRYRSGAVELRDDVSGRLLRSWGPKEARFGG
jgi:hypothetical protein